MKSKMMAVMVLLNVALASVALAESNGDGTPRRTRTETKRRISNEADRIANSVLESRLEQEELENVLKQLTRISRTLDGLEEPMPDVKEERTSLIEFAQDALTKDGYQASNALIMARVSIKPGLHAETFKHVFALMRQDGYGAPASIEEAATISGRKEVTTKMEIFKFICDAYKKDGYSNKQALQFGADGAASLKRANLKKLENYVGIYRRDGYSHRQSIEKALKLLEEDEKEK